MDLPILPDGTASESFQPPATLPPAWPPTLPIDTPGGRFFAEWDTDAPASREGQLIFFFQFLETSGLWKNFLANCPLTYSGNRGSGSLNVMGTIMLSVLSGHWRYAHINSIRGDGVNPGLLGMAKTVSEDVVRAALKRIDETVGQSWLGGHILSCIEPMLKLPWIMDMDTTVKPLYGHQEGAERGYNPFKPGRPCQVNHSFFMANTRICLGVNLLPGKSTASRHSLIGLWKILDQLPRTSWPTILRADCHYGNEGFMKECEARGLPYLFKLRQSPNVKLLVKNALRQNKGWQNAGPGWEVMEATLQLSGWSCSRRIVMVRESPAVAPIGENKRRRRDYQSDLPGTEAIEWQPSAVPWSGKIAVLVTSLDPINFPAFSVGRLYHERGDMENNYDELKNQWGWNGYVTQKFRATQLMANLVALFYNWWHLYIRLLEHDHHREAITSRPALMNGVARQTSHSGQRTVKIALVHENWIEIMTLVTLVSKYLGEFKVITERWTNDERWTTLLTRIWRHWLGGKWLQGVPPSAQPLLSG